MTSFFHSCKGQELYGNGTTSARDKFRITLNRRTGSSTSCATGASASLHYADVPRAIYNISRPHRTPSTSCATGASASLHYADVPRAIYNISRPHRTPKNYYVFALFYAVLGLRSNLYFRIYTRVYACIYTSSCVNRVGVLDPRAGDERKNIKHRTSNQ